MNPPFTRQERLPKEYKRILAKRFKDYERCVHGQFGLYGYFIFLADRFIKEDGRIAFVLPATMLRIATTQGIRDLLVENYDFEYIITTYQRAAFSEGASFREILLVAQKIRESSRSQTVGCLVVFLKRIPRNLKNAKEITEMLKRKRNELEAGAIYENEDAQCTLVNQTDIKASSNNLFKYIATSDGEIGRIWEKIEHRGLSDFKTS